MIYNILKELNIEYNEISHKAITTIEEAKLIEHNLEGIGTKTLFLKDKKKNFYLLVLEENKKANLKELESFLQTKNLKFANPDNIKEILEIEPGAITPLAIINDHNNKTKVILDKDLNNSKILVHPDTNTKTMSLNYIDLIKLIEYTNHEYIIM